MKRAGTSRQALTGLRRLRRTAELTWVRDGQAPQWTPEMFARAVARRGLTPMLKKALLSPRIDSDAVGRVNLQGVGGSVGAFCQRQETGVIY